MALGSVQAPLAVMAATSGDGVAIARKRAGGGGPGVAGGTIANGDAARAVGSLYECRNGKSEVGMNGISGNSKQSPLLQQQNSPPRLLTLPTVLTIGRVVAVPILVSTFYMDGRWGTTATTIIFLLAAITDWLDGYIARKMRLGTAFGAFLDPVADKLMVAATLVLLCTKHQECAVFGNVPWLLTAPSIAIIGREITMSAVREWAASQNGRVLEAVAVNNLGKWKTATQMTSLTVLLAGRDACRTECFSCLWCSLALYLSRSCCVVTICVHEKDMEIVTQVATYS
ncbi:hypothetical protein Cni_G05366 [Canna indica]|uniref:CDP-diacylglycerol--glycerol-3-phosphate 3-phosphatidyltransferase n=1 Tax=Canna indica TaxID=4628 RepID=A0AAQ3JWX0_9LILI|nr:hypothetical protein Cni_G05366 [Canna indica]